MRSRFVKNNFVAGEVCPELYARDDAEFYGAALAKSSNVIVMPQGGVTKRPGTSFCAQLNEPVRLIPFRYSENDMLCLAFGNLKMYVFDHGNLVQQAGNLDYVVSPFTYEQALKMDYQCCMDVVFFAHRDKYPCKLERSIVNNVVTWTFSNMVFSPQIPAPAAPTITKQDMGTSQKWTIDYKISAISGSGEESLPSIEASVKIPASWPQGGRLIIQWTAVTGAVRYVVYKNNRGYFGAIATVKAEDDLEFTDDNIEPDVSTGPQNPCEIFTTQSEYPGSVSIFQQRLVYGGCDDEPYTVFMSQPGNFQNFSGSYPTSDSDAITASIDVREREDIFSMAKIKGALAVFTSTGEYLCTGEKENAAVTPGSISFSAQSRFGSAGYIKPIDVGDSLLHVSGSRKRVRNLYHNVYDKFEGEDLTIRATHLFEGRRIVNWCYQQSPNRTIYAVCDDGKLLFLTYMKEQGVIAWSQAQSDGFFRDCITCQEGADQDDVVYFFVERNNRYLIERQEIFKQDMPSEDAFFVDSGKKYVSNTAQSEFSGLSHLAGKTISILADASPMTAQVDANGNFTIATPALKVIAGLPFEVDLETLEPATSRGSEFLKKTPVRCIAVFRNTTGVSYGPVGGKFYDFRFPAAGSFNTGVPLYTGCVEGVFLGHTDHGRIGIRQIDPMPFSLLGLSIIFNTEEI